jgi:hypothetical protein
VVVVAAMAGMDGSDVTGVFDCGFDNGADRDCGLLAG